VLRHELEHVLKKDGLGKNDDTTIDVDLETEGDQLPPEEIRANLAAADFCVSKDELDSFYERKAPFISERDVLGFSRRIQRHPGIVVGQLQRRLNRPEYLSRLKVKIRGFIAQTAITDGWGVPASVNL
jgi:HTH-type transcriptional regulator/antitoxin HigA